MKDIIVKKKMPKVYPKLVNTWSEWDSVGCRLARTVKRTEYTNTLPAGTIARTVA